MTKLQNKVIQAGLTALLALVLAAPTQALSPRLLTVSADVTPQSSIGKFSDWGISQFNSDLKIQPDSAIDVTETITADFTNAFSKHGLLRYIPVSYQDRNYQRMNIRFTLISVTDEKGTPYEVVTSPDGDNIDLKIGSADVDVSGQIKTYVIKYQLQRGINAFSDHDELFWNTTGNGWAVPISQSTTTITIPDGAKKENLKAICYTGVGYSTAQNCDSEIVDSHTFRFTTKSALGPSEGISVAASFPKGLVTFPGYSTYILWFFEDNWGYLLPLLVLLYCFYSWNKNGRDPKATHPTIMPEYEAPDKLSPAEAGTLLDDRVDTQDITSCIIDLATRGYLKIIEKKEKKFLGEKTTYTLERNTEKSDTDLKSFEQKIYRALFESNADSVELDDLKYKFYKNIPDIQKSIYEKLVTEKYYASNPDSIRKKYLGFGVFLIFFTFFFLMIFIEGFISLFIGLILSGIIIAAFSQIMPKKTQKGVDTYIHILGLEEFIKTAEKDRLKFYEKENIFEKILPYAIALGIADKWAKACEGLMTTAPSWYSSSDPNMMTHFNTYYFLNSLNSFNSSLGTTLNSSPRSSSAGGGSGFSGGFSGGGFGGGGGGSW
jgi:uncharacterized membrane protein